MALADLLYRCPFCGSDTSRGEGDQARCPGCGLVYEPAGGGFEIRVTHLDGSSRQVALSNLVDRMEAPKGDRSVLESSVVARFAQQEHPVRYKRELIGFFEERGPDRHGTLCLDRDRLRFDEPSGDRHEWPLLDLRAVQTASAAVQISPLEGGLVSFRIQDGSPRRWEDVLKARIREVWRADGRGEILEFQPRIRTAPAR